MYPPSAPRWIDRYLRSRLRLSALSAVLQEVPHIAAAMLSGDDTEQLLAVSDPMKHLLIVTPLFNYLNLFCVDLVYLIVKEPMREWWKHLIGFAAPTMTSSQLCTTPLGMAVTLVEWNADEGYLARTEP